MDNWQMPDFKPTRGPYVYAYLDPRKTGVYEYKHMFFDHEPFYVGKGCDMRAIRGIKAEKDDNPCFNLKSEKLHEVYDSGHIPIVVKTTDFQAHSEALEFENDLIKEIGRLVDGTGPLTNFVIDGRAFDGMTDEQLAARAEAVAAGLRTPEASAKMSVAKKGKKLTPEHSKAISDGKKDQPCSPEHRQALSIAHTGKTLSPEHRANIGLSQIGRESGMKGKTHSDETRAKMSNSQKGKPHKVNLVECTLCGEHVKLNPQTMKAHFKHNHGITDYQEAKKLVVDILDRAA